MGWTVTPRKPHGLDRLNEKRSSLIAYAKVMGWGELASVGELGDCFVFHFTDGTAVHWRPPADPDHQPPASSAASLLRATSYQTNSRPLQSRPRRR